MDHRALIELKPHLHATLSDEEAAHYPTFPVENKLFDNRYYRALLIKDQEAIESCGIDINLIIT